MLTMAEVLDAHTALSPGDAAWLDGLVAEWHLLADLAFSDLILWVPDVDDNVFWAAAQVRPTTGPTALEDDVVGEDIHYDPEHLVTEAYLSGLIVLTSGNALSAGIPVDVHAIPVVLEGRVIGFEVTPQRRAAGLKVPHMGWNEVWQLAPHALWQGIPDGARFYFVHSYYCKPADESIAAGRTEYAGAFTSAIARDNIFATQFHPEKSSAAGLALLRNFATWKP